MDATPLPTDSTAAVFVGQRGFAGRTAYQGCRHESGQSRADEATQCARPGLSDPASIAPMLLVPVCVVLIVSGVLIALGRGPGAWIMPRSRRRSVRLQALRRRQWIGAVLLIAGLISSAMMFGAASPFW